MPTIEISPEQAAQLARGQDITVAPRPLSKPRTYIAIFETGNVFKVKLAANQPNPTEGPNRDIDLKGQCTLIAKGPHHAELGHVQYSCGGAGYVVPIPN